MRTDVAHGRVMEGAIAEKSFDRVLSQVIFHLGRSAACRPRGHRQAASETSPPNPNAKFTYSVEGYVSLLRV